jgi:uncharacterized membrane protein YidH (DUF202 family)
MNRGAGTGLIAFGVVLVVTGAVLRFAVTVVATADFNVHTVGVILLAVGICSAIIGAVVFGSSSSRRSTTRETLQYSPGGRERVIEQHDVLP